MLEQILSDIPAPPDPEGRIVHGFSNNEDAVLVKSPPAGMVLVQTVDILGAIGNDARRFGQTAAANALSDVYAMGGIPWSVMNIAAFPSPEKPEDAPISVLGEIIRITITFDVFKCIIRCFDIKKRLQIHYYIVCKKISQFVCLHYLCTVGY